MTLPQTPKTFVSLNDVLKILDSVIDAYKPNVYTGGSTDTLDKAIEIFTEVRIMQKVIDIRNRIEALSR